MACDTKYNYAKNNNHNTFIDWFAACNMKKSDALTNVLHESGDLKGQCWTSKC